MEERNRSTSERTAPLVGWEWHLGSIRKRGTKVRCGFPAAALPRSMFTEQAQPLLLVDDGREVFLAINGACQRLGRWLPVMLIPK
jgi:hypothetical protein